MSRLTVLQAALTAVALALLAAPAAATAASLHVARDGDRLLVTGAPDAANQITVDRYEGAERLLVYLNPQLVDELVAQQRQGEVEVGSGCDAQGQYTATCGMDGLARVVVRLGSNYDMVHLADVGVPADVSTGEGGDTVNADSPLQDRIDGGPGEDTVTYATHSPGVVARLDGGPGGEDVLTSVETLEGSPHADVLTGGPAAERVVGRQGADVIDVHGGGADTVVCGHDEDAEARLDNTDHAEGCPNLTYGSGSVLEPIVRPAGGDTVELFAGLRRWNAIGLQATPTFDRGALVVLVQAPPDSAVSVKAAVAPWQAPGAVSDLALVAADAAATGIASVRIPLPPAAAAALAGDGRLRTRLWFRVRLPQGVSVYRSDVITAVASRPWAPALTGVRRKGGFGRQRLVGTPAGDVLDGRSADDRLFGGAGDDRLLGGTGDDGLAGEAGRDALDGGDGDDFVMGGPGNDDLVERRFGRDRLFGEEGDDVIFGGRGEDQLNGGAGDDVIAGGSGPDIVDCGPGDDVVFVNFAPELRRVFGCEEIHLEAGVVSRPCALGGTGGAETVLGTQGPDVCRGLGGDDDLEGAGGDDVLDGGDGGDRIFGRFGIDRLSGGAGDDELEGGRNEDRLDGGDGDDHLNGGYDPDVVLGGAGRDRLIARGGGADLVDCGPGRDRAYVDSADRVRRCEDVRRSGPRRRRA